ncbi:uncharacterized protein PRCAT00006036001 [Priceomyces carsonii]|uniref:uncharacterized protein n=1 Tax=Priceomyces carsonii TaxID=28549 RepID=UPI002ED9729E|nr:unnamed protein product [Priceomyces carsonii]
MTSPDLFHHVRVNNSTMKASHVNIQTMEYKSHRKCVDEYEHEILDHLLSFEQKTLPSLQLIQQQPEINLKMRPLLLDFLMDVINKLNLSKSTFPLTVNLIDRYCSTRIVKKQHYQLLGLTSLWVSCKNLDSKFKIPSLYDLCKMCCNCYDRRLFLEMENHLLKSLNWLIHVPTFDSFVDLFLNLLLNSDLAGSNSIKKHVNDIKVLSIYICELIQFYPNIYFNYNSSQISLGVVIISLHILDIPVNLHKYLDFFNATTMKEVLSVQSFNTLFHNLLKILKCPPPSLKLKYFNDKKNPLHLMKLLINFTNSNIEPMTPKVSTIHLPPTPVSNNISPRDDCQVNLFVPNMSSSPFAVSNIHSPPIDTDMQTTVPRKRSVENMEDRGPASSHLKRSKSITPMFFIS